MTVERKSESSKERSEKWAETHGIAGLAKGPSGESVADALSIVYAAREDAERETRERCAQAVEEFVIPFGQTNQQTRLQLMELADAIRKGRVMTKLGILKGD